MAVKVSFQNGRTQIISDAVRVDSTNFHEGMIDFYDKKNNLLEQISMSEQFSWEIIDEPKESDMAKSE